MGEDKEKEISNLLEENLKISEENNKILRKISRAMTWSRIFSILYWLVVLGTTVGLYYILQPFIESFKSALGSFHEGVEGAKNAIPTLPDFGALFQKGDQ